eukprot:12390473-Alexandrium_andersonii.AAC.1
MAGPVEAGERLASAHLHEQFWPGPRGGSRAPPPLGGPGWRSVIASAAPPGWACVIASAAPPGRACA